MHINVEPPIIKLGLDSRDEVEAFTSALFENWLERGGGGERVAKGVVDTIATLEKLLGDDSIMLPQTINVQETAIGLSHKALRTYAANTDVEASLLVRSAEQRYETARQRVVLGRAALNMSDLMREAIDFSVLQRDIASDDES